MAIKLNFMIEIMESFFCAGQKPGMVRSLIRERGEQKFKNFCRKRRKNKGQ